MASSLSSSANKVVLQSINGKTFEVDEALAKQSVMIEHLIKDRLTKTGHVVIPNVSGNILAKIVEYCNCVVTQPPSDENDIELKAFVLDLVNNDEQTLFGLLVAADYLDIKGLLYISCEDVLDMIKRKDLLHICRIFNVKPKFSPKEVEMMQSTNLWALN
ncbi:hypothetical protein M9H77_12658 [Catharanthus roseus]|uniref:Uncharacterized protein n=1 Tax=Catharanthus roseus TaxID=4058 RepID=A0ACC0BI77_CATRO|nr:hypothetical protein M9H77_12658 [Catharanthus roseus]